ncbi:hypothetical protein LOAG_13146, partial [Loa loa]
EKDKSEIIPSSHLSNDNEKKSRKKLPNDNDTYVSKINTNNQNLLPVSSPQSISVINAFGKICLVFIIVLSIVAGIQLWRRKRRLRLSNQRIVQFDQLQNEEENTM